MNTFAGIEVVCGGHKFPVVATLDRKTVRLRNIRSVFGTYQSNIPKNGVLGQRVKLTYGLNPCQRALNLNLVRLPLHHASSTKNSQCFKYFGSSSSVGSPRLWVQVARLGRAEHDHDKLVF